MNISPAIRTSYKKFFKSANLFLIPFIIYFVLVILLLNISSKKDFPLKLADSEIEKLIITKCLNSEINNKETAEILYNLSEKHSIDIFLLFGIIKTYSNFDSNLITASRDLKFYGLFQLNPTEHYSYKPSSLLRPDLNIELGIQKFKSNLAASRNNQIKALAMLKSGYDTTEKRYGRNELEFIENIYMERDRFKEIVDNFIKENYDLR